MNLAVLKYFAWIRVRSLCSKTLPLTSKEPGASPGGSRHQEKSDPSANDFYPIVASKFFPTSSQLTTLHQAVM